MDDLYQQLKQFGQVKLNESLSKHTTFKIGGKAQFFVIIEETKKLTGLLDYLSGEGINYYILGGGSNLLFSDTEFDGVVVNLQSSVLSLMSENVIVAETGVTLGKIVNIATQNSLSGVEWAIGIPGTVGGAVRGNAGAMGHDTGEAIEKVEVWRNGEILELTKTECEFAYRESNFKKNSDVILRVWFKLIKGEKTEIIQKVQTYLKQRTGKYPPFPSAGSFFKNIDIKNWPGKLADLSPIFVERGKVPVGWLVEQVAMKGYTVGGGKVSDEHGNFIINFKEASALDILKVVEAVKEKVYNKFGVQLEEEVEIVKG